MVATEPTTRPFTSIKRPMVEPEWIPEPALRAQGGLPDLAALGVNFTGLCYEDWRWNTPDGYFAVLSRYNHPAFINLTGAEQYADARKRMAEARNRLPNTLRFWRHMIHQPPGVIEKTDKGMWRLGAHEFVDNIVLAHGYHSDGYLVVTDCEGHIGRDEVKTYAQMEAERLDYGVPKGGRFGVLRMSTHNPAPEVLDSGDLDPLLKAIGRNMGRWDDPRVVITPNGYFDDTNIDGLLTARRIEERCIRLFGFRPMICFGEYGYDLGLTSEGGWRKVGLTARQNIDLLVSRYVYIQGMAGCAWGVGFSADAKVANFHLDTESLKYLMQQSPVYAPPGPIVIPPVEEEPPVVTPPAPEIGWTKARLYVGFYENGKPKGLNVRSSESTITVLNILATVPHGDTIYYQKQPVTKAENKLWLKVKTAQGVEGVAALLGVPVDTTTVQMYIDQQFIPLEEPEPPPSPDPELPKPPTDREYAEALIALHKREQAAYAELAACANARAELVESILERTKAT